MHLRELEKSETRHIKFPRPDKVVNMPAEWSMQYKGNAQTVLKMFQDGSFMQVCRCDEVPSI